MNQLTISKDYTKIPSDRRIFGNFIESGFGCQVRGMWSEMLYNRAFRKVPGYKKATWEWLGLDEEHYVEKLKEVKPSVVRFPGGCFVSFYNWESSIGDRDERDVQESYYWGGLEENDVGLDEFMQLSELVGFEPQMCFNMMTSTPFKAMQLVEYLNAPSDAGMGRLRFLNGREKPYSVRLFEMDNEPGRKWTAHQYAKECVRFARQMRQADPNIEFMLAAYSYAPELLPQMLEIAGGEISYVIYRQGNPAFVNQILPVIREYNKLHGTNLRLVNTEWLPSCKSLEPFEDPQIPQDFSWQGKVLNDYKGIFSTQQISWNYALNGAARLLDYISYGGEFALANFNNMCNTWGQNVIEATKDTCYLSCMGHVFAFFSRVFEPCTAAAVKTENPYLYALATKTQNGKEQRYLINRGSKAQEVKLPLPASDEQNAWIVCDGLIGKGRMYGEKETQKTVQAYRPEGKSGCLTLNGLSLVCLERTSEK